METKIDGAKITTRVKDEIEAKELLASLGRRNRVPTIGISALSVFGMSLIMDYLKIPTAERYIFSTLVLIVIGLVLEMELQRKQIAALLKLALGGAEP